MVAGNPASEMVNVLNQNRTAWKLGKLDESPGLGCIALQYAELCEGNCNVNNTLPCKPPEDDFTQVFAPNCGVELPTFGTITGHVLGCGTHYATPQASFSDILFRDNKSLLVLRNRSHTEVGVGMARLHKGTYFWCILFSDGGINSSFALKPMAGESNKEKAATAEVLFLVAMHTLFVCVFSTAVWPFFCLPSVYLDIIVGVLFSKCV